MTEKEKYKLALFATVRNSQTMEIGEKLGWTREEINEIARKTAEAMLDILDFEILARDYYGESDNSHQEPHSELVS